MSPTAFSSHDEPILSMLRFGLSRAIQLHSEDFRARNPYLRLQLDLVEDEALLPEEICRLLFHVYEQAMINIEHHATPVEGEPATVEMEPCTIWVHYFPAGHSMALEIKDDGNRFSIPADWAKFTQTHAGVVGMKKRVEAAGGTLHIDSDPNEGIKIDVRVPFQPKVNE